MALLLHVLQVITVKMALNININIPVLLEHIIALLDNRHQGLVYHVPLDNIAIVKHWISL